MVEEVISYSSEELGEEVTEDEIMKEIQQDLEEDAIEDDELIKEELEEEGFTPQQEKDMGAVAFLERNINREDKISVANLMPEELGKPTLPVRFWRQYAALFDGQTLYNMPLVCKHLLKKAQINEATSLSREAKALELAITNKRVRERKSAKAVTDFVDHIRRKESRQ
jgi:hypothetical protein